MAFSQNRTFRKCLHGFPDNLKSYYPISVKFCVQFYKCIKNSLLYRGSFLWIFLCLTFFQKLSIFLRVVNFFCFNIPLSWYSTLLINMCFTNVWNFKLLSGQMKEKSGKRQTMVSPHHFLARSEFWKFKH